MARDKADKTDKSPPATSATPATRGANEWGIPDWRDASGYAHCESWDLDRWRWEFLRRREDYRADYIAAYQDEVEAGYVNPLKYEGFFFHEGAESYGLGEFFAPAISVWKDYGPSWSDPEVMLTPPPDAGERWWQIKTLTFDLSKPIAPQVHAAKVFLLAEQGLANLTPQEQMTLAYGAEHSGGRDIPIDEFVKELNYSPRAPKVSPTKWALYLRVLDAREAGASLSQIAEILPASISRRDAKAAHNVYGQARSLQFRF